MANEPEIFKPMLGLPAFPPEYGEKEIAGMILEAMRALMSGNTFPFRIAHNLALSQPQPVPDWEEAKKQAVQLASWAAWQAYGEGGVEE